MSDTLVDHDDGDAGRGGDLVVEVSDDGLELRDLTGQNLVTHGVTDTISVDDEIGRLALILCLK